MLRTTGAAIMYASTAVAAAAADQWMSAALTGSAQRIWIWAFNGALLLSLGWHIWRLRREKLSAERGLLRSTREAVGYYSLEGIQEEMNEPLERLTGYKKHEARGATYQLWFPADCRARAENAFRRAAEGRAQLFESACIRKDGKTVDVEVSFIPIGGGSRPEGVYGIFADVTEIKRNRELLQQSDKLAVIGELAAGIAHEIRNPLTSLRGFVQLTHKQAPSSYTNIMISELDRIHEISNELLLLGKPRAMDFKNMALSPLIETVVTLINTQAILHNVEVCFEKAPDAVSALVRCEETKLKQVFLNVLKNAVEAMPNGGVATIRLECSDGFVRVRISDQGVGIPPDRLSKLGQAFYTTKESGTGLGIMISYNIVEQHGGRMTIESEECAGTTVDIRLPIEEYAAVSMKQEG